MSMLDLALAVLVRNLVILDSSRHSAIDFQYVNWQLVVVSFRYLPIAPPKEAPATR